MQVDLAHVGLPVELSVDPLEGEQLGWDQTAAHGTSGNASQAASQAARHTASDSGGLRRALRQEAAPSVNHIAAAVKLAVAAAGVGALEAGAKLSALPVAFAGAAASTGDEVAAQRQVGILFLVRMPQKSTEPDF